MITRKNNLIKSISILLVISLMLGTMMIGTISRTKASDRKPWADYTRITLENYGIAASVDEAGTTYDSAVSGTYTGGGLHKTYLDMDVNFNGIFDGSNYFHYFGSGDWENNIRFTPYEPTTAINIQDTCDTKRSSDIWVTKEAAELIDGNTYFNVKILTDMVANASDSNKIDVTIAFYFNENHVGTMSWTEEIGQNHNNFYFWLNSGSCSLRTPVVQEEPEGAKKAWDDYTRITMANYGITASKEESGTTYETAISGTFNGDDLNHTYLDVDINFNGVCDGNNYFHYFGSGDWENNIRVILYGSGLSIKDAATLRRPLEEDLWVGSTDYNVSANEFFNVKILTDIVENQADNTKDDVKLTFYVNEIYAGTLSWTEDKGKNHNNFYFWLNSGTCSLRTPVIDGEEPQPPENPENPVNPENPENPENQEKPNASEFLKDYIRVTSSDFAMIDEKFTHGFNEINWMGYEYPESLNHTYLDIDIAFCDDETFQNTIRYMSIDGWQSLQIGISGAELKLYETSTNVLLYSVPISEIGISADTYFNMKLSVDISTNAVDGTKKDVLLGLWVNNELVPSVAGENFVTVTGCSAVGNMLGIYLPNKGNIGIKINRTVDGTTKPTVTEQPNGNFTKLTFANFYIKNGTYTNIGPELGAKGSYILSLDQTVFSGNFHFSKEKGADFRYGGKNNPWNGLCFWTTGDGKLYMQDAEDITAGKSNVYVFHPMYAGVQLVDSTFNMKLSTEYIDSDGDGKKDDVKFGVWFNDILYRDEYIYLQDYATKMGSDCSIYVQPSDAWISIYGDESVYTGVDFELFGFSGNWKKEIGIR